MKRLRRFKQAGFTLIEIMVVVVILGILAAIIVPRIMSRPEQARVVKAKQDVVNIQNALDMYRLDNGFYPSQSQGLVALVKKPSGDPQPENYQEGGYLKEVPMDPWNHKYHYTNPGKHGDVDVYTYGPTNKPGGVGKDATIGNWKNDSSVKQTDQ